MWDGRVQGRKIECLNGSFLCGLPSDLMMTVNYGILKYPHIINSVWLVLILQYFSSPVFMIVSILVNKLDNSCCTFTGTSNKAMFHWRFMQLRGPMKVR